MKTIDVTALGELLIDFTDSGLSPQGNPLMEANPGGAPCNVLAMLGKLGRKCAFIGKVGRDVYGEQLKQVVAEKEQEILNGERPQSFYAYYPNQYHNGENWLQLMIIFPLDGYWSEESGVINDEDQPRTPDRDSDQDKEYDGYYATDDYEHLRVFTTATPEPDSAAAEYDEFYK